MAKKRPGPKKRPSQSQSGSGRKPYVRKPPFKPEKAESLITGKLAEVEEALNVEFNSFVSASGARIWKEKAAISTDVKSWIHDDGTITADLSIVPNNRRVRIDDILMELHKLDQTAVRGAWLSVGFYNPPSFQIDPETRTGYTKHRGKIFYKTHSRRWMKKHTAIIIEQARTSQYNFFAAHRRRPDKIVVRVWWSPEAKRPRRAVTPGAEAKGPTSK